METICFAIKSNKYDHPILSNSFILSICDDIEYCLVYHPKISPRGCGCLEIGKINKDGVGAKSLSRPIYINLLKTDLKDLINNLKKLYKNYHRSTNNERKRKSKKTLLCRR